MTGEQAEQLGTHVARRADDGHPDPSLAVHPDPARGLRCDDAAGAHGRTGPLSGGRDRDDGSEAWGIMDA